MNTFREYTAGVLILLSVVTAGQAGIDYREYAGVLKKYVNTNGMVDYEGLIAGRSDLDAFLEKAAVLDQGEIAGWSEAERIAFWINIYNALTLRAVIDHYPVHSIKDIGSLFKSVWDKLEFTVAGKMMTLNDIENGILRAEFDEPRIHMVINCASMSCPRLLDVPYSANDIESQFRVQTERFLSDPDNYIVDRERNIVRISSIFKWFGSDFTEKYGGITIKKLDVKQVAVVNVMS